MNKPSGTCDTKQKKKKNLIFMSLESWKDKRKSKIQKIFKEIMAKTSQI